jgi:UDP-3-O-[3-hydroxymyristoyl] glucosamine N-acyltransferase
MKIAKPLKIKEIIDGLGPLISGSQGDLETTVDTFATPDNATVTSLGYVISPKHLPAAVEAPFACVVIHDKMNEKVASLENKTWLFSPNPELAAREIKNKFFFQTPYRSAQSGIHATAVIAESATLAKDVTVGPYAIICENVRIGSGCFVGSHVVIEANCVVGENCTLHPHAYIGHSTEMGNHCEIMPQAVVGSEGYGYAHDHLGNHYRIPHTGKVILEDDVHVGASTCIDRGTVGNSHIGKGTKIDNHVHLAHNTVVGKNGLITAHVVVAGSTTIGDNFIVGGNSSITGHIKITDNVHLAGNTGVANDIREPGPYGHYPAIPLKQALKVKASSVHLPEFRKNLNKVMKKLFPEDYQ